MRIPYSKFGSPRWLRRTPPSLWALAQMQFLLGCVSLCGAVLTGAITACVAWGVYHHEGTGLGLAGLTAALTLGIPGALFLFGASVTRYLAGREQREYAAQATPDSPTEH